MTIPTDQLAVIGYGLLTATAAQKLWITYGGAFNTLTGRGIDLDVGASRPGRGHHWCDPIKGICCASAERNKLHGEPLLASLVRDADGTIGVGFATAYQIRYGVVIAPADVQRLADEEAAKCWTYFALEL